MALCTRCGLILNDKDVAIHQCKAQDIPAQGTAKKPTTTDVSPTAV